MTRTLAIALLPALLLGFTLGGCGDDDDPIVCNESTRLAVRVRVGGENHDYIHQTPPAGSLVTADGFGLVLGTITTETGATINQIVHMGSNEPLPDGTSFLSAIRAVDEGVILTVQEGTICDVREGIICGSLGTDENSNADTEFPSEAHHPALSGTATVLSPDGNTFRGTFDFEVGPNDHDSASFGFGDGSGGHVYGCFNMRLGPSQNVLN